jgi:hypothetical protein
MKRETGVRTMSIKGALRTLAASVLVLCLWANVEAQLARQGTYTAHFGWYAVGKTSELEKEHVLFVGEFNGATFNDAGSGFMHGTSWICPGMNDLLKGISIGSQGYCVVTDRDGDKAFFAWKGRKGTEPNKIAGDFQWTGGTGKYTGIKGNNTFDAVLVLPTSGYSVLKGEWQLP